MQFSFKATTIVSTLLAAPSTNAFSVSLSQSLAVPRSIHVPLFSTPSARMDMENDVNRFRSAAAKLRREAAEMEAEQARERLEKVEQAFHNFDLNKDGEISFSELKTALEKLVKSELPEERVMRLMQAFDTSGDGKLQRDEFAGVDQLRNKLDALTRDDKQLARTTVKEAKEMEAKVEEVLAQLELINDHPPTNTEKILSVLPFIFPLLDSLVYGRFLLEPIGDNSLVTGLAAIYAVYRSIPLSSFISVYTLNRLSEIPSINRQVRFNMQQGVYLEFALVIPGVLSVLSHLASTKLGVSLPITIQELGSDAVFLGTMAAIAYSTASSLLGKTPDIPIFSAEINKRVPSMAEFLDSDGSIDPAKIEKKILEMEKETAEKNE